METNDMMESKPHGFIVNDLYSSSTKDSQSFHEDKWTKQHSKPMSWGSSIISILKMKKLRHEDAHRANWQSQKLNLSRLFLGYVL